MKRTGVACWRYVALFVLLGACDCDDSGSPPTVQITSPVEGQRVTGGNRSVTVSGTGSDMASVEVKLNGAAVPAGAVTATTTTFTASVTLANNINTIEAIATNSHGSASSGVVTFAYPFAAFTTFQEARWVIGQADFSGSSINRGSTPDANTMNQPCGTALVNEGKLYLPDWGNNRVLVYDSVPAANGAAANTVLGQPNLTTANSGSNASTLWNPRAATAASGKLLVNDELNNRVVIFDGIPNASGAAANVAIGWDDPSSPTSGCAANRLFRPRSIFAVDGKLLVADTENNRVLIWTSIPTASGIPADLVLGQPNLSTCGSNTGGLSASTMYSPTSVWSDGTRVVVADQGNDRVLIWNAFPTENSTPADVVVGRGDFVGGLATHTKLDSPASVSSNGNQLFVAEPQLNRILVWNTFPSVNGASADVVLGQSDFEHGAPNDDDQLGGTDGVPTARTLNFPSGVALWGNQLFVADTENNRFLVFDGE